VVAVEVVVLLQMMALIQRQEQVAVVEVQMMP
jgi:hypothetical protein